MAETSKAIEVKIVEITLDNKDIFHIIGKTRPSNRAAAFRRDENYVPDSRELEFLFNANERNEMVYLWDYVIYKEIGKMYKQGLIKDGEDDDWDDYEAAMAVYGRYVWINESFLHTTLPPKKHKK